MQSMDQGIQVLIVGENSVSRAGLRAALHGTDINVVGESGPGPESFNLVREVKPDAVLLNVEDPLVRAIRTLEALATNFPEIPVIALSSQSGHDHVRKAMLAGARDYLAKPVNGADLSEALATVVRQEQRRQLFRQARVTSAPDHGSVIAVFGPKGGVGKSTVAVNLGVAMAKARQRVALVDLDLAEGADAIMLDMKPKKNVLDVPQAQLDRELLRGYMTEHSSGLHLLAAPTELSARDPRLESLDIRGLLEALASVYEYVVVDTPPVENEHVRALLRSATYVLVLTSLEIPSINLVKKYLETMRHWEFARDKIKVVTNVANCSNSVKTSDIEEILGLPVFWTIPHDPKVGEANQQGQPLVERNPRTKAAKAITRLHYTLTGLKPRRQSLGRILSPLSWVRG